MLEKIGTEGYATISKADDDVLATLKTLLQTNDAPRIAELGVGIGSTTLEMAKLLNGRGEIHIFDFQESVDELSSDLKKIGFPNVVPHGNSGRHWDSYHWSLSSLVRDPMQRETFDLIYIDGAHTYLHDALAFFMCDRLLKIGGKIIFDDYFWSFSDSRYLADRRDEYMTKDQENAKQIKLFIDDLVKTHIGYKNVIKDVGFEKIASTHRTPKKPSFSTRRLWKKLTNAG